MSAMVKGGAPVVFWLTLRFCCRLIRALTGYLERSVSQPGLVDMGWLLSCQQRDAEWQQEPSEPVDLCAGASLVLLYRVDLSFSAERVALLFTLAGGDEALLQMSLLELRQWLAIVYRQFQRAGWPLEVWPEWFTLVESGRN